MKFSTALVPAIIATAVTTIVAQESADRPAPGFRRDNNAQPGAVRTPGAQNFGTGANAAGFAAQRGIGFGAAQNPLQRILSDDAAIARTGIDKEKIDAIKDAFKKYDDKITELEKDLPTQQEKQAKLVADKASEEEVGAAVDALFKTRAEIAKLQTFKILKVNKSLTSEELEKVTQEARARMPMPVVAPGAGTGNTPRPNAPAFDGTAPRGGNRPAPADGAQPGAGRTRGGNRGAAAQ